MLNPTLPPTQSSPHPVQHPKVEIQPPQPDERISDISPLDRHRVYGEDYLPHDKDNHRKLT